jgi:hypothetical protein
MQELRDVDYVGIFLFTGGALLFLLGLSWGGELYAWNSGYVIGTLVSGAVTLVSFVLYGKLLGYMHLRRRSNFVQKPTCPYEGRSCPCTFSKTTTMSW